MLGIFLYAYRVQRLKFKYYLKWLLKHVGFGVEPKGTVLFGKGVKTLQS